MHASTTPARPTDRPIAPDRALLKELARPAPARLLLQTAFEWSCIVALVVAAVSVSHPAFSLACMLLIATRQHALLTLMHEYAHQQLSRRRTGINDLVGDVFTALPFFITIHGFRRNHLAHHRHVCTDQDPNWVSSLEKPRFHFPKTRAAFAIEVLKHGLGRYTLVELKGYTVDAGMSTGLPRATRIRAAACAIVLAGMATYFGLWGILLLYWIVPLATFLMAILYVRDVGEHFGMPAPGIERSRTVLAGWLERVLIAQNGVNFHAEHHLFPSVPFFRLGRLHQVLMQDTGYRARAVVTRGYLRGLWAETTASPPPGAGLEATVAPSRRAGS
jgi:fatty acid desaturase